MITKTKLGWILHGCNNIVSTQEAILNICCEDVMSLKNFGVVVTKIDCRKSEEERLSLKMMADSIQNVGERFEAALPYRNDVEPFTESRSTALNRLKCTVNWRKQVWCGKNTIKKLLNTLTRGTLKKLKTSETCVIDQNYGTFLIFLSRT
jgi:hypothetical protein